MSTPLRTVIGSLQCALVPRLFPFLSTRLCINRSMRGGSILDKQNREISYRERAREIERMEWRKSFLDLVLVPTGLLINIAYHCWLLYQVRNRPMSTIIGINAMGRRMWVAAIMKDNDKKNILAVQTLRNSIMGSTLMATTCILLCTGLAAVISSTYSVKKPVGDAVFGAHGEVMVALKYVALLLLFLFTFLCHTLSIRFLNQVNFLINIPADPSLLVTCDYVYQLLEKGSILNTVGNRLFYVALPLLLWIFGPVMVFLCSVTMVPILYNLDVVFVNGKSANAGTTTSSTEV